MLSGIYKSYVVSDISPGHQTIKYILSAAGVQHMSNLGIVGN